MSADEVFSINAPDIDELMDDLKSMNSKMNMAIRKGVDKGTDIILEEQKRLIRGKSKRLAGALAKSKPYITSNNKYGIKTGYQSDCFNESLGKGDKYWRRESLGVMGLTYEFGRPGKSVGRTGKTMRQTRMRKPRTGTYSASEKGWKWKAIDNSKPVPTEVDVKKGIIPPIPHVRRGFDHKLVEALTALTDEIDKALD